MKAMMKQENEQKVWVGEPKLDRVMGIEKGMIVLRSRDRRLLNKLVSTALVKNDNADTKTFYLYASPGFLRACGEFIHKISQELGLDKEDLMKRVNFVDFSTESPMEMEERWGRVEDNAEATRLLVVDSLGHHRGRDSYLAEKVNRLCYQKNALALVLDTSEELDNNLERLSSVVVDLDAKDNCVEVFLRKHPRLNETLFLMSP